MKEGVRDVNPWHALFSLGMGCQISSGDSESPPPPPFDLR